jgi:DNA-3-methyladenine glycosylase II
VGTTGIRTVEGTLSACPPFDFARTLAFLRAFSPMTGEQAIAGGALTKAVTLNRQAVAFTARAAGSADEPSVVYRLAAERPLGASERRAMEDRVSFFLSLGDDLRPFYALASEDSVFGPVVERLYGLHQPKFLTPFENACWAILTQRTPLAVAQRIKARLVERYGTHVTVDSVRYRAFPETAGLMPVDTAELAGVIGSERKAEYLRAVIEFFDGVDEEFLRHGDFDQVAARLRAVRGMGEWSTMFVLIRGLGRIERVPAPERALAEAAARIYGSGQPFSTHELRKLLDRYGPYQGYWAIYVHNVSESSSTANVNFHRLPSRLASSELLAYVNTLTPSRLRNWRFSA